MPSYPWQLVQRLSSHISNVRRDAAHAQLDRVLAVIGQGPSRRLDFRRLRCAQVLSFCLRGAHAAGAPSRPLLLEHMRVLDRLARAKTWAAIHNLVHQYVDDTIDRVRPQHSSETQRFINQMRRHMRESMETPRALQAYARDAGVSVAHLSRTFKEVVGTCFGEERRCQRMATAAELLRNTPLKISAIARRVGFNDPSQFIAAFRREQGVTPNLFRLQHRSPATGVQLSATLKPRNV